MERRRFLTLITAGTAGLIVDPEKLLWIPGKKTIFIPSAKQVEFINSLDSRLWGIPYHQSNAFGVWLGFSRVKVEDE